MKSIKLFFASLMMFAFTQVMAQEKTESIQVNGECGMCKKKIETAAKSAGASYAAWSSDSKVLSVKYDATASNKTKIEQAVAKAGYDTENVKATDEAYNKLDGCCKYERTAAKHAHKCDESCMKDGKCDMMGKMKDGKCDMSACKDAGKCDPANCTDPEKCKGMDCCKKA